MNGRMKQLIAGFGAVIAMATASHGQILPEAVSELDARVEHESVYYKIDKVPLTDEIFLEVTGMAVMPEDRMAISTRRGEIWLAHNISADNLADVHFVKLADGLHEPMGISYEDGWFIVTQRSEVTKIRDEDGDGRADLFETLSDGWGISGDYHEFAFGSAPDKDGNIWVALCLSGGRTSDAFLRGWAVRVSPDGEMIPSASGIRSPGGLGQNATGDLFYTDNQGFWNGSSSLKNLFPGSFQGSPVGNIWYDDVDAIGPRPPDPVSGSRIEDELDRIPNLVPPAVIFPHGRVGQSPTGFKPDTTEGAFGPFAGQLFVAEYTHSQVNRVFLEQINGVWQGAVVPFLAGFATGEMTVAFTAEGQMYVGGMNRGWPSLGSDDYALERVAWTGETPFELLEMRATQNGFDLEFTQNVDPDTARDLSSYAMESWTYIYRELYGSPEVDQTTPRITNTSLLEDGKTIRMTVDGRVKGHVHLLEMPGLRSTDGESLLHPEAYYTLNEIPAE